MDLMEFMLSVSDSLMKFEKTYVTRKRGRRASEPTAEEEVGPSRSIRRTIQPEHNTRTDQTGHWPEMMTIKWPKMMTIVKEHVEFVEISVTYICVLLTDETVF
ncbi:hypothetical protein T06_4454 [Trichinella sp. T6]|nr:hypothetical protein T06_4454 [Trichinella sp. T6]